MDFFKPRYGIERKIDTGAYSDNDNMGWKTPVNGGKDRKRPFWGRSLNYQMCNFLSIRRKLPSIFLFVEEKIVFARIIGPDILDAFIDVALVLDLLQILDHFERST